jgi:hypothetical protein
MASQYPIESRTLNFNGQGFNYTNRYGYSSCFSKPYANNPISVTGTVKTLKINDQNVSNTIDVYDPQGNELKGVAGVINSFETSGIQNHCSVEVILSDKGYADIASAIKSPSSTQTGCDVEVGEIEVIEMLQDRASGKASPVTVLNIKGPLKGVIDPASITTEEHSDSLNTYSVNFVFELTAKAEATTENIKTQKAARPVGSNTLGAA